MLWLWCSLVATALIQPLAWEPPYAEGAALKKDKKKTQNFFKATFSSEWSRWDSGLGPKDLQAHATFFIPRLSIWLVPSRAFSLPRPGAYAGEGGGPCLRTGLGEQAPSCTIHEAVTSPSTPTSCWALGQPQGCKDYKIPICLQLCVVGLCMGLREPQLGLGKEGAQKKRGRPC